MQQTIFLKKMENKFLLLLMKVLMIIQKIYQQIIKSIDELMKQLEEAKNSPVSDKLNDKIKSHTSLISTN